MEMNPLWNKNVFDLFQGTNSEKILCKCFAQKYARILVQLIFVLLSERLTIKGPVYFDQLGWYIKVVWNYFVM